MRAGGAAATPRTPPLVDTNVAIRPPTLDGAEGLWKQWKFTFEPWVGSLDDHSLEVTDRVSTRTEMLPGLGHLERRGEAAGPPFLLSSRVERQEQGVGVRHDEPERGWIRSVEEYHESLRAARGSAVRGVVEPNSESELHRGEFYIESVAWTKIVEDYETESGSKLDVPVKTVIAVALAGPARDAAPAPGRRVPPRRPAAQRDRRVVLHSEQSVDALDDFEGVGEHKR